MIKQIVGSDARSLLYLRWLLDRPIKRQSYAVMNFPLSRFLNRFPFEGVEASYDLARIELIPQTENNYKRVIIFLTCQLSWRNMQTSKRQYAADKQGDETMNGMIIEDKYGELLDIVWPKGDHLDLSGANLRGANLSGADLIGADLIGADLSRAYLIDAGQDSRGYRFVARHGQILMIAAGCRWLNAPDAREHWKSNSECLAKVEMIIAEATRRGWTI